MKLLHLAEKRQCRLIFVLSRKKPSSSAVRHLQIVVKEALFPKGLCPRGVPHQLVKETGITFSHLPFHCSSILYLVQAIRLCAGDHHSYRLFMHLTASYTQLRRFPVCSGFCQRGMCWQWFHFSENHGVSTWSEHVPSPRLSSSAIVCRISCKCREFSGLPLVMYHHRGNYDFICHQVKEEQSPWINNLSSFFIVNKDNRSIEGATIDLKSERSPSRTLQSSVAICGQLIPIEGLFLPSVNRSMCSLPTTRKSKNVDMCVPQWFLSTASFVAFQLLLLL